MRNLKPCTVIGCGNNTSKGNRLYCGMHYSRLQQGKPLGIAGYKRIPNRSISERVYSQLKLVGECWEWMGALRNGYGAFGIGKRIEYVHRWVYQDMVATIPAGLVLDHLCVNRKCANPYHLEPVTGAVNKARGSFTRGERRVR